MEKSDYVIVAGIILVLFGVSAYFAFHAEEQIIEAKWKTFAKEHNCTQLMETETITTYRQGVTVGPDGAMHPSLHTTVIPSKRAYTCDDGVTYWR